MQKRKKRYIVIIIILVCIIFLIINSMKYEFLQEDLLFFQIFNSENQSTISVNTEKDTIIEEVNKEETSIDIKNIYFNVRYQNTQLRALNLKETIDNKTLVYEKIAPGTSGRFDIVLNTNKEMNYKIVFESKNEKPSNLQFYTSQDNKKYATLEELGEKLVGRIIKKEEKVIPIYWEWVYEISEEQNKKDTLEATKIREYNFFIYVQGY